MKGVSKSKSDGYEGVINVFETVFREVKEQAKKKAEATLNASKVRMINKILEDVRAVVDDEPEAKYLELLDDDELPQMGDAVIVMAQYEGALKGFRARHYGWDPFNREQGWFIEGK